MVDVLYDQGSTTKRNRISIHIFEEIRAQTVNLTTRGVVLIDEKVRRPSGFRSLMERLSAESSGMYSSKSSAKKFAVRLDMASPFIWEMRVWLNHQQHQLDFRTSSMDLGLLVSLFANADPGVSQVFFALCPRTDPAISPHSVRQSRKRALLWSTMWLRCLIVSWLLDSC